jgi:molybdenum cofactor biosynthesis enzyme MoaA
MVDEIPCLMPWKALFMDEKDGRIAALPCCLSWIKADYGTVGTATLAELWNSSQAQRIRFLIANGRQQEICDRHCPYLLSGRYGESALRVLDGSPEFVENQLLNNEEIRLRRTFLQSRPMFLKVLPTLRCNIRCTMCFQEHYRDLDLGPNFWSDIEQSLPFVHEITFQGGEVTLMREFRNFLKLLRAYPHVKISLITNGTILDDDLYLALSEVAINYIIVSVNAATHKTFLKVTKTDLYDRVIDNVVRLRQLSAGHRLRPFDVFLSFVVMRSNFRELPEFLQMCDRLNTQVQLLHVIGDREGEDIFERNDLHQDLRDVLEKASGVARGSAVSQVQRIRVVLEDFASQSFSSESFDGTTSFSV